MGVKWKPFIFLFVVVYLTLQTTYLMNVTTSWITDDSDSHTLALSTKTTTQPPPNTDATTTTPGTRPTTAPKPGAPLEEHLTQWRARVGGSLDGLCTPGSQPLTEPGAKFLLYQSLLARVRPKTMFRRAGRQERPLVDELDSRERLIAGEAATLQEYVCHLTAICRHELRQTGNGRLGFCPCLPPALHGFVEIDQDRLTNTSWGRLRELHPELKPGGSWAPTSCIPRRRVAIIVPFRDRETHLRAFLAHIHPIMQRQLLHYRIFIVEQNLPYLFNKAALMNAGYLEAKKLFQADCVMFHDVDTLTERDDNMVVCGDEPIHWGGYSDRYKYGYNPFLFGSAVLLRPDKFELVNGFSNLYYGWGAEDDNFKHRFLQRQITIYRGPMEVTRCTIMEHARDRLFTLNDTNDYNKRVLFRLMQSDPAWQRMDGLTTTQYRLLDTTLHHTHTRLLVNINRPILKETNLPENMPPRNGRKISVTDYKGWTQRMGDLAHRKKPAMFNVTWSVCARNETDKRHFLSRVSCRFRCEQRRECKMFEYHSQPTKELDSFCILRNTRKCKRGHGFRYLREHAEIHIKLPKIQNLDRDTNSNIGVVGHGT